MAVAFKMKFEGATLEEYDRVMELMGLDQGDSSPDGAVFHWAAATDNGIIVVDVWGERRAVQQVRGGADRPLHAAGRDLGPPSITRYEIHNTLVGEAAANHPASFART